MSDQHIQEVVIERADGIGQNQEKIIKKAMLLRSPILGISDLYNAHSKKII